MLSIGGEAKDFVCNNHFGFPAFMDSFSCSLSDLWTCSKPSLQWVLLWVTPSHIRCGPIMYFMRVGHPPHVSGGYPHHFPLGIYNPTLAQLKFIYINENLKFYKAHLCSLLICYKKISFRFNACVHLIFDY